MTLTASQRKHLEVLANATGYVGRTKGLNIRAFTSLLDMGLASKWVDEDGARWNGRYVITEAGRAALAK